MVNLFSTQTILITVKLSSRVNNNERIFRTIHS